MDYQQRINREAGAQRAAAGLGWFSIALGVAELLFAGRMARALGMGGREGVIRLYGVREVATGIGLLASQDREKWLWARVAGDGLDLATLAAHVEDNPRTGNVALAIGAVAGATAMDVATANALAAVRRIDDRAARAPAYDYSDRSGFPMGLEAAWGAARDFAIPRDFRAPEALRH